MKTEIVMIGTELLLGQIVDSNAAYIGRTLAEHGIPLYRKTTVGDNLQRIVEVFEGALARADVILTSGGLGPTEDDLTREAVAAVFNRPLERDPALIARLEAIFEMLGRPMTANNRKQADVVAGGRIIENPNGTAPGLIVEDPRGTIICMPGVPHELYPMLEQAVVPYLRERFGIAGTFKSRVLKVCGIGESAIDQAMGDLIRLQENPTVGVLASPDVVRIRIVARADSEVQAAALIAPVEAAIHERLPGKILGADDDTLESVVDALLTARGWRLVTAETDSGGVIAQRMAAAEAKAFAGGLVLPIATEASPEAARDLAARATAMVPDADEGALCVLAIAHGTAAGISHGYLRTPLATREWTAQYPGLGSLHQIRVGVGALEQLRRVLIGS